MFTVYEALEEVIATSEYGTAEVILWYSLLLFSVILLVIYILVKGKKNKSGLAFIQSSIQKELKMVVAKKEAVANNQKVDLNLYKTSKKLSAFIVEFNEVKEKTSLPDADALINKTQKLIKAIHAADPSAMTKEETIKYLDKVIERLTFIYGKLDVIRALVK